MLQQQRYSTEELDAATDSQQPFLYTTTACYVFNQNMFEYYEDVYPIVIRDITVYVLLLSSPDCPEGFWGSECQSVCVCENGGSCDQQTGLCVCTPGFTGSLCQEGTNHDNQMILTWESETIENQKITLIDTHTVTNDVKAKITKICFPHGSGA